MRSGLILFLLTLNAICIHAQHSLKGKIIDSNGKPISYANVVLLSTQDSLFVAGTTSDDNGLFDFLKLTDNQYRIEITLIGYENLAKLITINDSGAIEEFVLEENTTQLDEVTVTGTRKLYKRLPDRLVVDVENSLRSNYGNAVDVLAVTPGLRVQNNQLQILGKQNVVVFINNQPSNLSGESLMSFLETLSSQSLQSIEIFSIPPPQFEINGNAGLINIVLKANVSNSWKANVGAMFRKRTKYKTSTNASFFYNKNKFSFSNSFYLQEGIYHQGQENASFFMDEDWFTESSFDRGFLEYNNTLTFGYQLLPNYNISLRYLFSNSDQSATEMPFSNITDPLTNDLLGRFDSEGFINQERNIHLINQLV